MFAYARKRSPLLLLFLPLLLQKGLNYLHQRQYLHQDVKPGNILLTLTHFAKLADFGLTVDVNAEADALGESYSAAVAVGSARYWPPELWGPESKSVVESAVGARSRYLQQLLPLMLYE